MARASIDAGFRSARMRAGGIVAALTAVGVAVTLASSRGSVWRDLGLAVLSGAIVGGALVTVESLLARAAEERASRSALLSQLSTTIELEGIDLSQRDLTGLYLPGRSFVAANLEGTRLDHAKLQFGDFRNAALVEAALRGADLSGSTLTHGDLRGARLDGASLWDVDLSDASLAGAHLRGATIIDARLRRTSFCRADLSGATLRGCYLEGADLRSAITTGLVIEGNQYDDTTLWPDRLEPPESERVDQAAINEMDLATYLAWRASRDRLE